MHLLLRENNNTRHKKKITLKKFLELDIYCITAVVKVRGTNFFLNKMLLLAVI